MADNNFIFNSDWNYQKIYANTAATVSVPTSGTTYNYAHGLGKITSARVWIEGKSGKWFPAANIPLQDHFTNGVDYQATYYLTTSQLVVNMYNTTASTANVNIQIRIYVDD